jgi:hypothetical protein
MVDTVMKLHFTNEELKAQIATDAANGGEGEIGAGSRSIASSSKRAARDATAAIMEQAQVFASTYSLVGGPFDRGNKASEAIAEKDELKELVLAALEDRLLVASSIPFTPPSSTLWAPTDNQTSGENLLREAPGNGECGRSDGGLVGVDQLAFTSEIFDVIFLGKCLELMNYCFHFIESAPEGHVKAADAGANLNYGQRQFLPGRGNQLLLSKTIVDAFNRRRAVFFDLLQQVIEFTWKNSSGAFNYGIFECGYHSAAPMVDFLKSILGDVSKVHAFLGHGLPAVHTPRKKFCVSLEGWKYRPECAFKHQPIGTQIHLYELLVVLIGLSDRQHGCQDCQKPRYQRLEIEEEVSQGITQVLNAIGVRAAAKHCRGNCCHKNYDAKHNVESSCGLRRHLWNSLSIQVERAHRAHMSKRKTTLTRTKSTEACSFRGRRTPPWFRRGDTNVGGACLDQPVIPTPAVRDPAQ